MKLDDIQDAIVDAVVDFIKDRTGHGWDDLHSSEIAAFKYSLKPQVGRALLRLSTEPVSNHSFFTVHGEMRVHFKVLGLPKGKEK